MAAQQRKIPGFSLASLVLFVVSLVTPQIVAAFLLVVAIITGVIGYSKREWDGTLPLTFALLSLILLGLVAYNLYTAR